MTQIVTLVKGSSAVVIQATKVEEIIVNKMIKVIKPITPASIKAPGTLIVDLKKLEHVFNIAGFIGSDLGSGNHPADLERTTSGEPAYDSGDTAGYSSAKGVKDSLIKNILYTKGNIDLYYRDLVDSDYSDAYNDGVATSTTNIKTVLDKVSIQDVVLRADVLSGVTSQARLYPIQLNLTRGKIRA